LKPAAAMNGEHNVNRPEVLVVGSGIMGRGIAKSFAAAAISSAMHSRNAAPVTGVDPRGAAVLNA